MKYLQLLSPAFIAIALASSPAIFSHSLQAQNTKTVAKVVAKTTTITDAQPTFNKGKLGYSIEKIEYTADEMIIHFLYHESYSSIIIYPPKAENAWHILDNKGKKTDPKAIRNLRHADKIDHLTAITQPANIHFITDYDTYDFSQPDEKFQFRCEIVFPRLNKTVKTFDLIEGSKEHDNYFHVLNVQHRHSENTAAAYITLAPVIEVIEEPMIIEEKEVIGIPEPRLDYRHATIDFSDYVRTSENPAQVSHDKDYTVEKIRYYENQTIVTFAFQDDVYPSGYFYDAQGKYAWFLRDQDGNIYNSTAVYNVRANGTVVTTKVKDILTLSTLVADRDDIANRFTCDIAFPRLPASVRTADLIEGIGQENTSGHFNVKQIDIDPLQDYSPFADEIIDMSIIDFKEIELNTPPEEIAKEAVGCDENCKPGQDATTNYSLFPNPNKGVFNLTNNGIMQANAQIQLFNLNGQQLFIQKTQLQENTTHSFKVDNLPAGQYLLRISHQDKTSQTLPVIVVE
jgi:hypothetical protein